MSLIPANAHRFLLFFIPCVFLIGAAPAHAAPAQRLQSEHFVIQYDPDRLEAARAMAMRDLAERGFAHCLRVFGKEPPTPITCDLTPDFAGATGFAVPGRRPRIGVRIPDLEYLGLNAQYVLTHEIAHIFSGQAASGPFGEGLADVVAGEFGDLPLQPWWGGVLRRRGLWVDPDALFVTGDYPTPSELDARLRIARYTEPALLLQYLVGKFGLPKVLEFLPAYSRARGPLDSNELRTGRSRRPPDADAVRATFQTAFGTSWEELRRGWEATLTAAAPSTTMAERLALSQQIYATIRGYEMWRLKETIPPPGWQRRAVREAFTAANRALGQSKIAEARAQLDTARRLISEMRHPMMSTDAKLLQRKLPRQSLTSG
jgi:hypothetical protein